MPGRDPAAEVHPALLFASHAFNNPLKFTDPTGHDPWWNDPDFYYSDIKIYIDVSIKVQSPFFQRPIFSRFLGQYTGVGPGKITDAQMETDYDHPVIDPVGEQRGYGLGMRDGSCMPSCPTDQYYPNVANVAMGRRIQLVLANCKNCSETDRFIVAALAENGPGFTKAQLRDVMAMGRLPTGTLDWNAYLDTLKPKDNQDNRSLIQKFTSEINKLKLRDEYVPDVDWEYISQLY